MLPQQGLRPARLPEAEPALRVLQPLFQRLHQPAHVHFVDFRILSRNGKPPLPHERGPTGVVYLEENEAVRLLLGLIPGAAELELGHVRG